MARVINEVWVADFETATPNTEYYKKYDDTKVLLWYTKSLKGDEEMMGVELTDMMYSYMSLGRSIMVFFHNLNFDGDFIIKWLIANGYTLYNKLLNDKVGFSILKNGRQIYEIKVRYYSAYHNDYYVIVFRCSWRILSHPVESLGKSVGIAKYKEGEDVKDFYDVEPREKLEDYPENFREYCKRDVDIVRLCLIAFDDAMNFLKKEYSFLNTFNWKSKLTASSISLKLQKEFVRHFHNPYIAKGFKHDDNDNQIATEFYFGGFTQFNFNIQGIQTPCKNGVGIDINSAHPFSMTKKLPYGKLYNMKETSWEDCKLTKDDVCEFFELQIDSAELKPPGCFALLANWPKYNGISDGPIYQFNRYLTEAYGFRCFYMREEFEALCKYYTFEGVTIVNHWWMMADKFLGEFVNQMYKFKSDFKAQGKEGLSWTFKIILNGGYGIHAKRNDYDAIYVCKDKDEYDSYKHGDNIKIGKYNYTIHLGKGDSHLIDGVYIHLCKIVDKPKANNKFIASAITAWSRIYLWEAMEKIGFDKCAYTDTDSIYTLEAPKNLGDVLHLDKYELGAWDIENTYTDIFVLGAKSYYIKKGDEFVKAKYSGINSKWLKDNLDESIYRSDNLEEANLTRRYTKSGVVLIWKDYAPKERHM